MSTPNTKKALTPALSQRERGIKRKFLAFTLVELIVVITILVILGTIAFINLGGFSGSARDSARISNLANLQKGLNVYQVKTGTYPMPESSVAITASGTPIGYQGFAKDIVGGIAKISKGGTVDPSDTSIYTTYAVNQTLTKMQAMVFLEDSGNVTAYEEIPPTPLTKGGIIAFFNPLIKGVTSEASWGIPGVDTTYASLTSDYSKRFPKSSGDTLGILLSTATGTLNQPVQESGTGVDVVLTNTGYLAVFSKSDSVSGSGNKLVAMKTSMTSAGTIPLRDSSLIGYWDMETTTSDGKLADLSGNGNNGTASGGVIIGGGAGNGRTGRATLFNLTSTGQRIIIPHDAPFSASELTISLWAKNYDALPLDTNSRFIGKGHDTFWQMYIGTDSDNNFERITPGLTVSNGNWWNNVYKISFQSAAMFHLYTFVYKANMGILYFDGKIADVSFTQSGTGVPYSNTKDITIGNDEVGFERGYKGTLDEVRIYNRALGDSEIQTLYNATK